MAYVKVSDVTCGYRKSHVPLLTHFDVIRPTADAKASVFLSVVISEGMKSHKFASANRLFNLYPVHKLEKLGPSFTIMLNF